jgi:hypothetical protein
MAICKRAKTKNLGEQFFAIIINQVRNWMMLKDVVYQGIIHGWWWPNCYLWDRLHHTGQGLLGLCAFDPMVRPFHVSFCGRWAWIEVLEDEFLVKLRHPLRKPFHTIFKNLKIFRLHKDWCANFTLFACVRMECVNHARSMLGCMVG